MLTSTAPISGPIFAFLKAAYHIAWLQKQHTSLSCGCQSSHRHSGQPQPGPPPCVPSESSSLSVPMLSSGTYSPLQSRLCKQSLEAHSACSPGMTNSRQSHAWRDGQPVTLQLNAELEQTRPPKLHKFGSMLCLQTSLAERHSVTVATCASQSVHVHHCRNMCITVPICASQSQHSHCSPRMYYGLNMCTTVPKCALWPHLYMCITVAS